MRGADEQPGSMFSYVSLEERVPPDHPLRAIRRITDRALERLSPRFGTLYVTFRAPVDCAGEAAARAVAAGALHDPQRAAADGATRLQPAVSLVRGARDGRRRVVADDVHEESRSAARRRHRGRVLRRDRDPRRHGAAAVRRSFHRRRHVARGLGESQEFPAPGSRSRPPEAGGNPTVNFHRQRRTNETHRSTTDPDARLYKKAQGVKRGSAIWAMC